MVSLDVVETGFVPVGPKRTFEGAVEQIAERVWSETSTIDVATGINTAINRLRTNLGDDPVDTPLGHFLGVAPGPDGGDHHHALLHDRAGAGVGQ